MYINGVSIRTDDGLDCIQAACFKTGAIFIHGSYSSMIKFANEIIAKVKDSQAKERATYADNQEHRTEQDSSTSSEL